MNTDNTGRFLSVFISGQKYESIRRQEIQYRAQPDGEPVGDQVRQPDPVNQNGHKDDVPQNRQSSVCQMEAQQPSGLTPGASARTVGPSPALVPEEIVQDRQLDSDRGGRQNPDSEAALEQHQRCQLNHDAGGPYGVEPQAMAHSGSARYSARVCRITDTARISAIPAIPIAPPMSNIE